MELSRPAATLPRLSTYRKLSSVGWKISSGTGVTMSTLFLNAFSSVHNAGITKSLVYGPGQTGLSHVADEYIEVEDLVLGTKGLALIIADLLEGA